MDWNMAVFWWLFWSTASGVGGLLGPGSRSGFPCVCHKMDQQKHRSQIPENQDSGFHRWRHQSLSVPQKPKRWRCLSSLQKQVDFHHRFSNSPGSKLQSWRSGHSFECFGHHRCTRWPCSLSPYRGSLGGKMRRLKVGGKHDSLVHFNTCLDLSLKCGPIHWRFTSRF